MSTETGTPSAAAAAAAAKEGKGKDRIGKVIYRVRTAFKRGDSSRRKTAQTTVEPLMPAAAPGIVRTTR